MRDKGTKGCAPACVRACVFVRAGEREIEIKEHKILRGKKKRDTRITYIGEWILYLETEKNKYRMLSNIIFMCDHPLKPVTTHAKLK